MKAFVVNEDQIIKATIGAVIVVALTFSAAFYLGYSYAHKTESVNIDENGVEKNQQQLKSSEENGQKVSKLDKKTEPSIKNKGSKTSKSTDKKSTNKPPKKKAEKKKSTEQKASKKKDVKKKDSLKNKKQAKKSTPKSAQAKSDRQQAKTTDKKKTLNKAVDTPSSAQLEKEKSNSKLVEKYYSIQAGMFSNEVNANSFIEKLSAKKYDAYLVGFESSAGGTKYNVRVGKFESREAASELLDKFQKSFSSPAYVVITQ